MRPRNQPGFVRFFGMKQEPTNTVQGLKKRTSAHDRLVINETILQIAEAEYERQYPPGQTIDRLRERGGLSISEVVSFLASAVTRYAPESDLRPQSLSADPRKRPLDR